MIEAAYDKIAKEYQDSKQLPFRKFLEAHTLFQLWGDVRGRDVLDLACGDGIYTRKLKEMGGNKIVGMDLSSQMVSLAEKAEKENPIGVKYLVGDAAHCEKIGNFDIVLAVYLLNYAKNKKQLTQFLQNIFMNLKPGGRLIGINDNPGNPQEFYSLYRKYGFIKSSPLLKEEEKDHKKINGQEEQE